jgi:hypothetical protein
MTRFALALAAIMLTATLAWAHPGGLDKHGCHNDTKAKEYHCHEGALKDKTYKSQDTMLKAHPEMRTADKKSGDAAKKEKAVDKVKDGDRKTTDDYAKDAKKK